MKKKLIAAAALCALTGCTVPMQTVDASRAACSAYGFVPGSEPFAECVQQEQHIHTLLIYGGGGSDSGGVPVGDGQSVIGSGDCIGAVVNGVCHGSPAPMAPMATCHGQMINGMCTGPML